MSWKLDMISWLTSSGWTQKEAQEYCNEAEQQQESLKGLSFWSKATGMTDEELRRQYPETFRGKKIR